MIPWAPYTGLWGQWSVEWIAYYRYREHVLGLVYPSVQSQALAVMHDIARSCGWWYPYAHAVIACDRPRIIQSIPGRRIIQFRDGWSIVETGKENWI